MFSFSYHVFYDIVVTMYCFSYIEIVVCHCFEFGKGFILNLLNKQYENFMSILKRLNIPISSHCVCVCGGGVLLTDSVDQRSDYSTRLLPSLRERKILLDWMRRT